MNRLLGPCFNRPSTPKPPATQPTAEPMFDIEAPESKDNDQKALIQPSNNPTPKSKYSDYNFLLVFTMIVQSAVFSVVTVHLLRDFDNKCT